MTDILVQAVEKVFKVGNRLTSLEAEQLKLKNLQNEKTTSDANFDKKIADQQAIVDAILAVK